MNISLRDHVESWQRFGSYPSGVYHIAKAHPLASFDAFLGHCGPNTGGWAKALLREQWEKAR